MRGALFGFFRNLHAWGGVTLALLILLSSVTGTLLVWKEAYLWLAVPEARADFNPTPEALARIAEAVEANFDNNEILQIQFATEGFALTRVVLADARYAYVDTQGGIVDEWVQNERWEEWLYDLHHRLLLEDLGLTIVGVAALAMAVLVLVGAAAFWPMRRGFRHGFWPRSTAGPHLRTAHRNIGIIEALPFLLTLVTGVVLAFPDRVEELLLEPLRRTEEYSLALSENVDDISGAGTGEWLPAMRRALATFSGGEIRSAQVPNTFNSYRIIGIKQPGEWHPHGMSRVYIDAPMGYMDVRIDATSLPLVERAYNGAYPLHTGKIGALPYQLFLTVSGLLVAALSMLGLISFIRLR